MPKWVREALIYGIGTVIVMFVAAAIFTGILALGISEGGCGCSSSTG